MLGIILELTSAVNTTLSVLASPRVTEPFVPALKLTVPSTVREPSTCKSFVTVTVVSATSILEDPPVCISTASVPNTTFVLSLPEWIIASFTCTFATSLISYVPRDSSPSIVVLSRVVNPVTLKVVSSHVRLALSSNSPEVPANTILLSVKSVTFIVPIVALSAETSSM